MKLSKLSMLCIAAAFCAVFSFFTVSLSTSSMAGGNVCTGGNIKAVFLAGGKCSSWDRADVCRTNRYDPKAKAAWNRYCKPKRQVRRYKAPECMKCGGSVKDILVPVYHGDDGDHFELGGGWGRVWKNTAWYDVTLDGFTITGKALLYSNKSGKRFNPFIGGTYFDSGWSGTDKSNLDVKLSAKAVALGVRTQLDSNWSVDAAVTRTWATTELKYTGFPKYSAKGKFLGADLAVNYQVKDWFVASGTYGFGVEDDDKADFDAFRLEGKVTF